MASILSTRMLRLGSALRRPVTAGLVTIGRGGGGGEGFLVLARGLHASALRAAVVPFNLADIGEGIAEALVLQW